MSVIKEYDAQEEARLVALADSKEQQRVGIAKAMRDMAGYDEDNPGVIPEGKGWEPGDVLRFKQLEASHDMLQKEITGINGDLKAMRITKPVENGAKKNKESALLRWIKKGDVGLDSHERADQEKYNAAMNLGGGRRFIDPVFAAAITPAGNPDVLDETVVQQVIQGLHAFGGAIQCFTVAMTADGNVINYPVYDDYDGSNPRGVEVPTGAVSAQQLMNQGEGAISTFDQATLSAYPRGTKYLDISQYFNEDVRWDVASFVRMVLMRRMGFQIEKELTQGGITDANIATPIATFPAPVANVPRGFMVRAGDVNSTNNSSNKTTLNWEDLNTLIHAIDHAYLMGEAGLYGFPHRPGKVGFMLSWSFLGAIKNLKDGEGRPLVIPSIQDGSVNMLMGYPMFINYQMPYTDFSDNHNRPIYFGNWGYMAVRFSGAGFAIEEFYDSNTAPANARRYLGRIRYDSEYIGTLSSNKGEAIKALKRNVA